MTAGGVMTVVQTAMLANLPCSAREMLFGASEHGGSAKALFSSAPLGAEMAQPKKGESQAMNAAAGRPFRQRRGTLGCIAIVSSDHR